MLPYLTAAGHYKHGQQSLHLYLSEMKKLPDIAPEVHIALVKGAFVGRRADGHHNGVSPDMKPTMQMPRRRVDWMVSLLMLLLEPNGFTQSLLLQRVEVNATSQHCQSSS